MCISYSKDKYKRYLGVCFLDNLDLNKWMVENGYAIAYKNTLENMNCKNNMQKKINLVYGRVLF